MDDVRDEVDVALSSSSSRVHAERLFGSKAEEEQFGVMDVELVRWFPLTCALLQICVVPEKQRENSWQQFTEDTFSVCVCVCVCVLTYDSTLLSM